MSKFLRMLPIGVQSFVKMRGENFIYADKTKYIYDLSKNGGQYFLSRPRRFGKSLFLSTLKAYWEGRRELFDGLKIVELTSDDKEAFSPYPVFYFDFNGQNYKNTPLEDVLDFMLSEWEKIYGCEKKGSLSYRFQQLLIAAKEKTGKNSVVLVDEYDKPLLESLDNDELEEHNKAVFKGFFGTLKSYDEYLRFVFITGVTKFSKVSIFSDLNQLSDISLDKAFDGICGITQSELENIFAPEIGNMANTLNLDKDKCIAKLKKMYDGYHFCPNGKEIYNPFSLLNAFSKEHFGAYWFATGTPTFLTHQIKNMDFDVRKFTNKTIYASEAVITDYRAHNPDIVPLLYQTGYLTIVDYNPKTMIYTLGFPNAEVKYGFLESLFPEYVPTAVAGSGKDIFTLLEYTEKGKIDEMRDILKALFASIPYTSKSAPFEHYFQTIVYIVFTLLGKYVRAEVHSSKGRADVILENDNFVYIFEFKLDKSAKEALKQIEEKEYALPYAADKRTIYKIGVSFNSKKRSLVDWAVK